MNESISRKRQFGIKRNLELLLRTTSSFEEWMLRRAESYLENDSTLVSN